jgi:4-hydroxy-tetrahydrodipicolinate synthase
MNEKFFEGVIPPLVTPFKVDGSLDEEALRGVIRYVLSGGVHGVFIGGSTGESYAMDDQTRIRAFEVALDEVNGQVPVFAGTAHITTSETIQCTKAAEAVGVDAVSIVTPFFITPNESEIYDHYCSIAKSTKLPVILYNNPDRTGVNISIDTIKRLSSIDNIVGIKDSSGDMTYVCEIIKNASSSFSFFCGKDTIIYSTLVTGGKGAVPASGNVAPALIVEIYNAVKQGDLKKARDLQFKLDPLRNAFSLGSFPVVLKEALNLIGVEVGAARLPIKPLSEDNRSKLKTILKNMELLRLN